jgi:glucokinase
MTRFAIGVDVGGTTIKGALVDERGTILLSDSIATPAHAAAAEDVVGEIVRIVDGIRSRAEGRGVRVEGCGFGTPSYSLGPEWIQTMSPNIPALEGYPLHPALRDACGDAIACDLDTHAATIAEHRFGAGGCFERSIFIAIGTGISCGIVVDGGTLVRHTYGTAGDTGHLIVDPVGRTPCSCGGRGCLETVASASAIRARAAEAVRRGEQTVLAELQPSPDLLDARDVFEAARHGDRTALEIFERAGRGLGVAIASLMHVFCPHAVLVGGGVSEAGELLLGPARATIDELASPFYRDQLQTVRLAALGADAGVVGAATLILFPSGAGPS